MKTEQRCGTCEQLMVHPDKDGVIRVRKDRAYGCRISQPEVKLPLCYRVDISKRHVLPEWTNCPAWSIRLPRSK